METIYVVSLPDLPLYLSFPGPGSMRKRVSPLENSSPQSCLLLFIRVKGVLAAAPHTHLHIFNISPGEAHAADAQVPLTGGFIPYTQTSGTFLKAVPLKKKRCT